MSWKGEDTRCSDSRQQTPDRKEEGQGKKDHFQGNGRGRLKNVISSAFCAFTV